MIGYQPWFLTPSAPVNSFLDTAPGEMLKNTKVVSLITCRSLWKRSYRIFAEKVNMRQGTLVASYVIEDQSKPPENMVSTVFYLLTGIDIGRGILRKYFRPFGIGDGGLQQAREMAADLCARLDRCEF
jgi:hypothetical protein